MLCTKRTALCTKRTALYRIFCGADDFCVGCHQVCCAEPLCLLCSTVVFVVLNRCVFNAVAFCWNRCGIVAVVQTWWLWSAVVAEKFWGNLWYLSDSCYLCLTFRAVLATYGGTCSSLMGEGDLRSILFIVGNIWKNRRPIANHYLSWRYRQYCGKDGTDWFCRAVFCCNYYLYL